MNAIDIIEKYYNKDSELYAILVKHSHDVMHKALSIVKAHPELNADAGFIAEASMLHDIGISLTYAPSIKCYGEMPYICHGYLGREILEKEGLPKHALVCERHTGVGLTVDSIRKQQLPLPERDMTPISTEEQIICFADCFFSKTKLDYEKSVDQVRKDVTKYGEGALETFELWVQRFL